MEYIIGYLPKTKKLFVADSNGGIKQFKDGWMYRRLEVLDYFCKSIISDKLSYTCVNISNLEDEFYYTTRIFIKSRKLRAKNINKLKEGLELRVNKWNHIFSIISELES